MMWSEFEKLVGHEVDSEDYSVIEYVYMHHPIIDNVKGKKQIAELYKIGGMCLIADMVPTAKAHERMESKVLELRRQISDIEQGIETILVQMDEMKNGVYATRELKKEV